MPSSPCALSLSGHAQDIPGKVPLATLNLKDYEDFTEYHGLRILGAQ